MAIGSESRGRLILGAIAVLVLAVCGVVVARRVADQDHAVPDMTGGPERNVGSVVTTLAPETADTRAAPSTAPPAVDSQLPPSLVDFFPIGVDFQPVENFELWKERGINTVIRAPDGADINAWADAADAAGLYQIRPPRDPATDDIGNPMLLAWSHRDEPDFNSRQIPAEQVQAEYEAWKELDPDRPVLINVTGDMESTDRETGEGGADWYGRYFAAADWISGDIYPVNRDEPLTWVGQMVDEIESVARGKPVFAYIESSDFATDDFNSTRRSGAPTPAELRGEIWHAIIRGARGIWYFPARISPTFGYDETPDDVAAEMPRQHELITSLASVLQGPIDPPGIKATVAAPLEVTWRDSPSGSYFIVLNMSDQGRTGATITLEGVGSATTAEVHAEGRSLPIVENTLTDDFGPYAVHIYRLE